MSRAVIYEKFGGPEVLELGGRTTRVIELGGGAVLPGFNDPHAHVVYHALSSYGADLTGSLLSFARKQALHPEPIDVNVLVRDFAQLLRRAPETSPAAADRCFARRRTAVLRCRERIAAPPAATCRWRCLASR